jgi:purine nucleosidase
MPPALSDLDRIRRLEPPAQGARLSMVLDTDTFNEIDDQFALAYALLSPDRLDLQAVYAAPFGNDSTDPATGMRQSYDEILRVLDRFDRDPDGFVFAGSERWLSDVGAAVPSAAADDLIARARRHGDDEVLYVVAIGAPTNVSSALLAAPDIARTIVVVWLGGNPTTWPTAHEYNLEQDVAASRVLLDSGVPLVHVPCVNVTEHLRTTLAEVDAFVRPAGRIGAYLAKIFEAYRDDHFARSKVIWDVGAVAWLVNPEWTPSALVHSPVLTSEGTWSHDPRRHLIREMLQLDRDAIFGDLFRKLRARG